MGRSNASDQVKLIYKILFTKSIKVSKVLLVLIDN